jgi:hypothetical protein
MEKMTERNFINGYYLLEQDLKEILSFVEPTQKNLLTYSHRIYSLYMRACIEFEANCKRILSEEDVELPPYPKISTYNEIHNFDQYKLIDDFFLKLTYSEELILQPFKDWSSNKKLFWYQDYNDVKHSRVNNFEKANLENLLNAIGGVLILLFATYGIAVLGQHHDAELWHDDADGFIWTPNSLFKVHPINEAK